MKVKESKYLKEKKPLLKELLDKLLGEYSYASILACDAKGKAYNKKKTSTAIAEDDFCCDRGFVIKVYDGKGYGEFSFDEISEESIDAITEKIRNGLVPLRDILPEGVSESEYAELEDEKIVLDESTDCEIDPDEADDSEIVEKLTKISEKGLAYDKRIIDCSVNCSYQRYTKLFLSKNRDMTQSILWTCAYVVVLSKKEGSDEVQSCYRPVSMLGGLEVLDGLGAKLEDACKTALELLDSEPMVPGEYDCVCTPEVTGMIVHEAFGHGVEMDMFVKDRALAKKYIGEYVASPLITMRDGASTIKEVASYFFDDEGVPAHDTYIIEKGILKRGMCDSQSAMSLGVAPTGNGRREKTGHKAYTRMTNTIFDPGTSTVEEMIASIDYGFLLQDADSGMEDPKNWGIQCMVSVAREIKDGKLTGKMFSPVVLSGYVPDLLKSISMISKDFEACGSGYCGKGYKEWVKVSDGGPYIKAKIRLG